MNITYRVYERGKHQINLRNHYSGIKECVDSAFGRNLPDEHVLPRLEADAVILGFDSHKDKVVAFCTVIKKDFQEVHTVASKQPRKVAYFDAATISSSYQGYGIYSFMNRIRITTAIQIGLNCIVTRTQNPNVEKGISRTLTELSRQMKTSFAIRRYLVPNAYEGRLTGSSLHIVDNSPFKELDIDNGDAFLLVFELYSEQH